MHLLPRQSSPTSAAETTPSSTDAPSSTTASSTPSSVTPEVTTSVSSTPTSPTETSTPPTTFTSPTTSSSVETTSAAQHTSASQSSSNAQSSSSDTPTSSPSLSASSSSSSPPSDATQPPASSSSRPETLTTITSAYTTYLSGSPILTTTTIPSTIPQVSASSSNNRSAVIAGSAAGGTALLILFLSLAFFARRKRFKRLHFLDAITLKRRRARSRATLLDGGDIPDTDLEGSPRRYTDYETPWNGKNNRDGTNHALMAGAAMAVAAPSVAPHWSDTGSAFREDVWPPPGEATRLMDPLVNRDDIGLGQIVDDVMGPSTATVHFSDQSISSTHRGSTFESEGLARSRTVSNASHAALLEAAGLSGPLSVAPVRSSPLAQPKAGPGPVGYQGENV